MPALKIRNNLQGNCQHQNAASALVRCCCQGGKVAEGTVMAADPALSLPRIQEAAHALLTLVSDPASLPEFEHLQVLSCPIISWPLPSCMLRWHRPL